MHQLETYQRNLQNYNHPIENPHLYQKEPQMESYQYINGSYVYKKTQTKVSDHPNYTWSHLYMLS